MDRIEVEGFCSLGEVCLAGCGAVLGFHSHFQILLCAVRDHFAQKLCKFCSMLSFFISSLLPIQADFRIAFTERYAAHRKIHTDFGAFAREVVAEVVLDVFRNIGSHADNMLCSPGHLVRLFCKFGSGCFTDRTCFRSRITFIDISADVTYPFCHDNSPFIFPTVHPGCTRHASLTSTSNVS